MQVQHVASFDGPLDDFTLLERHGFCQGAGEVDVPLVAFSAGDELGCGRSASGNASKDKSVCYGRAGQLEEQLKVDIAALMKQAEEADVSESVDPQKLPDEIARRDKLLAKMRRGRNRLGQGGTTCPAGVGPNVSRVSTMGLPLIYVKI